ncbi:MAG TPA: tyrosine-type recombinase/integrase [Hyphomicrobiaceae bacterium]|nr:tyrosine-type recombinase/integrase [Hyphomicrobiaceae bacterium]
MKLDAKSVAALKLDGKKKDAIYFDDSLKGFGFRLRAGARGKMLKSWIVQYRHAGAGRRYLIGPAEAIGAEAARAEAKKVLARIWTGEDPQGSRLDRRDKDRVSFRGTVEDFLAAKEPHLRPRTLLQLRRYLADAPYLKAFHALPLDRITKRDVASRILTIARENGPAVAREVRSALSSFYVWARRQGLCETNPVIDTERPRTAGPRERVLSDDELAEIWRACGDDEYGKIIKLLFLTGCRRAEIGDMRWSEINLDKGTWTLPGERSKNGRPHTLPLMPMMREIIDTVPKMATRDALFGRRGRGFTAWSWAPNKPALDERSGVGGWTVHDIRRSVATKMANIGVPPHIIEAVLGHYSGHRAGIAGFYNKSPYEREVRNALAMWHGHLRALVVGGEHKVLNFPPPAAS